MPFPRFEQSDALASGVVDQDQQQAQQQQQQHQRQQQQQQQQHYDYQNGYLQSGHVVSYASDQIPTSAGVPPTINYPLSAMSAFQQASQHYQYQMQEHAYQQNHLHPEAQLAPSYPYSTAAVSASAISPSDVFAQQSPPTPYAISPGLNHPSISTPISGTPNMGGYDQHRDYFGQIPNDSSSMSVADMMVSEREPSPGSKKKRVRPKPDGMMEDEKKDAKDYERPRLPHNEVERKYRESLNLGFERLRATVPTLPKLDSGAASVAQKQSKAAVLGAAIDYIRQLEGENERLQEENRELRAKTGDLGEGDTARKGSGRRK